MDLMDLTMSAGCPCTMHPQVCGFLRARPDCCPPGQLLSLARSLRVPEVEVLLLEREGRLQEAATLLRAGLQEQVEALVGATEDGNTALQWTALNTALIVAVTFLQRVSSSLATVQAREELWCPLLATVSAPLAKLSEAGVVWRWRELVRHVVSSMLGHVRHDKVVAAVLADPGYTDTSNWSELRRLLGEIIDTFR